MAASPHSALLHTTPPNPRLAYHLIRSTRIERYTLACHLTSAFFFFSRRACVIWLIRDNNDRTPALHRPNAPQQTPNLYHSPQILRLLTLDLPDPLLPPFTLTVSPFPKNTLHPRFLFQSTHTRPPPNSHISSHRTCPSPSTSPPTTSNTKCRQSAQTRIFRAEIMYDDYFRPRVTQFPPFKTPR
jgi:hypothetical protein